MLLILTHGQVDDLKWHYACFKCHHCEKALPTKFYADEVIFYCCFFTTLATWSLLSP